MSNGTLPKPGDSNYPTDPVLAAAIEAERKRRQQDATKSKSATKARASLDAATKLQQARIAKLEQYTAQHDTTQHGISGLVSGIGNILKSIDKSSSANAFYVNAQKWEKKASQAAEAYAKNPSGTNLKKYNEAKAEFTRYANDYVASSKDKRSADEIWGSGSVGSLITTGAKTTPSVTVTPTPKPSATGQAPATGFATWGRGTATGSKTSKLANGTTVETFTNGVKIYKAKNGSQITVNKDGSVANAISKSGKQLTDSQISAIASGIASSTSGDSGSSSGSGSGTGRSSFGVGTGGTGTATPTAVKKTASELALDYNVQMAVINSDSSLKTLFNKAVAGQWTPGKFAAELRNTTFYTTYGSKWANARIKQLGDPGDWKEQLKNATVLVKQEAVSLGISLDDNEVANLAKAGLYSAGGVVESITGSWLDTHIAQYGQVTGKGGKSADIINNLKQSAQDYGISYSDKWYSDAAKSVIAASSTENDYISEIKNLAKTQYASFAKQIEKGMTVKQIADPYVNAMANTFETSDVNIYDPTIQKALTNIDPTTNKPSATPLWQFQQELKQDNRYFKTNQAKQSFLDLATNMAQQFGLM